MKRRSDGFFDQTGGRARSKKNRPSRESGTDQILSDEAQPD
jgi:hypothetical protein